MTPIPSMCYNPVMPIKSSTLTLRLGPKLREDLEVQAAEMEMTLGEFVRYIVAEYLRQLPSTEEPAA